MYRVTGYFISGTLFAINANKEELQKMLQSESIIIQTIYKNF